LPSPPTLAKVIFVGDAEDDGGGEVDDVLVGSDNRASDGEMVRADGTAPAGASAISLTSRVVRLSERALPERDWTRMVTGPRKWRKSYTLKGVSVDLSIYLILEKSWCVMVRRREVGGAFVGK
jgi:hypothetical protein